MKASVVALLLLASVALCAAQTCNPTQAGSTAASACATTYSTCVQAAGATVAAVCNCYGPLWSCVNAAVPGCLCTGSTPQSAYASFASACTQVCGAGASACNICAASTTGKTSPAARDLASLGAVAFGGALALVL